MTIKSQIITKLKPMKSPRSPPQSAKKDKIVYDQTSLLTVTFGLPNLNQILVEFTFLNSNVKGCSITFDKDISNSISLLFSTDTLLFSIDVFTRTDQKAKFPYLYLVFHIIAWF